MVNKIIVALILTAIIICLVGCGDGKEENSIAEGESTMVNQIGNPYEEYFDAKKDHIPTEGDVKAIKDGMSIADIIEKIGKPHG